ncbi:hypothetical protein CHLRE_03g165900v5 [Chlamydomonas reinhardtii]|uniref:Phosphoglycerate mutase-like protein n=1 Tax=Chlamydomonas reinhardtii TaxID=3055 RepID=A0A2K3DWR3_CHLRE|nr:uncharacterized protein CHLRE_03g165900v5 [Chlamydomonas reinhardtii]PNW84963.1 hypothetical protein CHLRE_03g165900v5 [Chlamydomonas reinhardtii]
MALFRFCCPCLDSEEGVISPSAVLEPLVTGTTGSRTLTKGENSIDVGPADSAEQNVYVVRHGHRQDEEDDCWHVHASRPWDPPLSTKGRQQAREAGQLFKEKNIDYVLTSPFLRCLQTSAEIVDELGLAQGRWLVVWPMCELCDPRLLLAGRDDVKPVLGKRPIREWMWDGQSMDQAVEGMLAPELAHSGVRIRPEMWSDNPPTYPEKLDGALKRYEKQIKGICKDFAGRNVLVVTHGEALRAAVNMHDTRASVYEVRHTGYVPLHRERKPAPAGGSSSGKPGAWGPWNMVCTSGQTGVMWSYA